MHREFYLFLRGEGYREARAPEPFGPPVVPVRHASNAFAVATVVGRHYGWKLGLPTFALASYIAISRVAANDHHVSDVVAGAALGFGVGAPSSGATVARPNAPNLPKSNTVICLDGGPASDGIGLRFAIDFR